jgi:hypothetical protein
MIEAGASGVHLKINWPRSYPLWSGRQRGMNQRVGGIPKANERFESRKSNEAAALLDKLVTNPKLPAFLTLEAYGKLS